jgi:apolipoprotein N-acyltransferase
MLSRMPSVAALLAGLLLFASDQPLQWWPLQLVALVPLWWSLQRVRRLRWSWWYGLLFGLGYNGPLLLVAGQDLPILATGLTTLLQWIVLAPILAGLLRRGPIAGTLAAAAALTLAELLVCHAVPLFGTAQSFVRPLSAAPALCAFVAFTGTGGVVLAVALWNGLLLQLLRGSTRRSAALGLLTLTLLVGGLDLLRWLRPLGPSLRVAAFGWHERATSGQTTSGHPFDARAGEAAAAGAKLLVTPETGTSVGERQRGLDRLGGFAKQHGIALAVGVWLDETGDNRIWLFDTDGSLRGEYRKTHLVPWLEDYRAGDGTLVHAELGSLQAAGLPTVGGMICQDDNFTDLARGYGRAGTQLVVVPTNDWASIRGFHAENGIFRAIESGYAVVRAASGGISLVLSPRGEVVARVDHVEQGPQLLVADMPLGDGEVTVYARCGDWLVAGMALALLCVGIALGAAPAARDQATSARP